MKCKELLDLMNDYVDGDLDREEFDTFRRHLLGCGPCEVVIDNVRHTIGVYKSGHPVEVPDALQQQLSRVLRERWAAKFPSSQT